MNFNVNVKERAMHLLGSLAFGVMTVVNLIVLGLVLKGLVPHRSRHR
jgi:hypothetical protein